MSQSDISFGFYVRGAVAANIGGSLVLTGFSNGQPVFAVTSAGSQIVDTTEQTNALSAAAQSTVYNNTYSGAGTVAFTLPVPDPSQRVGIGNQFPAANALLVQAPAGTKIRWTDGTLHSAIESAGNAEDNITLIGESATVWLVTYAGESGQSTWTPQ